MQPILYLGIFDIVKATKPVKNVALHIWLDHVSTQKLKLDSGL